MSLSAVSYEDFEWYSQTVKILTWKRKSKIYQKIYFRGNTHFRKQKEIYFEKIPTSIVGEKIETISHPKNNYFKKHAMKGKNTREKEILEMKKKILIIKYFFKFRW